MFESDVMYVINVIEKAPSPFRVMLITKEQLDNCTLSDEDEWCKCLRYGRETLRLIEEQQ